MDVQSANLSCVRCKGSMQFEANRQLEDVSFWNFFNHRMYVTVMRCTNCGHMEMFDQEILEEYLNRKAPPSPMAKQVAPPAERTIPLATEDLED